MADNLFSDQLHSSAPLADAIRPQDFSGYVGQEDLAGENSTLRKALRSGVVPSCILWGPPGSGKTTLAHILARSIDADFVELSATRSGKKELTEVIDRARSNRELHNKKTILFVDEIHRWNKAQQDALLPAVEKGIVTFIGATTENPSFSVISALLSRVQVFVLKQLSEEQIAEILDHAAETLSIQIPDDAKQMIAAYSNGDARTALNVVEYLHQSGEEITKEHIVQAVEKTAVYDKTGEEHYNIISALHKSMRASDADAALYWAARMLSSGEDPRYLARRIVRFASEDIGNAKPNALVLAIAAYDTAEKLGMPECNLAILQAVEYCARAPKSRALDNAWFAIQDDLQHHPNEPVPMHLRNAPTKLMKQLGYGKREQESNLPANLAGKRYIGDQNDTSVHPSHME